MDSLINHKLALGSVHMVDSFDDDAGLAKYFHVQKYRENQSGRIALSVYCLAATVRNQENEKRVLIYLLIGMLHVRVVEEWLSARIHHERRNALPQLFPHISAPLCSLLLCLHCL